MTGAVDIDSGIRREAIAWAVRLSSGSASADDHRACAQWRTLHPQHEQAWARLQSIRQTLTAAPADIAAPALRAVGAGRRRALKGVAGLALGASSGWFAYREQPWRPYLATFRAAVGEQRRAVLADGSTLWLNTGSAVDVDFSAGTRLLRLLHGELLVSAPAADQRRPLVIASRHGTIESTRARVRVRLHDDRTEVGVLEAAVQVRPRDMPQRETGVRLEAGIGTVFNERRVDAPRPSVANADAWTRGQLVVQDQTLGAVVAELARYRPGVLRCSPAVAGIRVSGVFPINDTDQVLAILAGRFPIAISSVSRYWVSVDAAS